VRGCLDSIDPWTVLVSTLVEGCLGQAVAALSAVEGLASVRDPSLVVVLNRIARDEQRHGELAWRTLRWLLGANPEFGSPLRGVVERETALTRDAIERVERDPASDWLLRHGLLSDQRRASLRLQVLDDVVAPSLAALCATIDAAAA